MRGLSQNLILIYVLKIDSDRKIISTLFDGKILGTPDLIFLDHCNLKVTDVLIFIGLVKMHRI